MEKDNSLDADIESSSADEATVVADKTTSRCDRNPVKVPRKINKARREKLKRERFNDMFLDLAKALDIKEPNNGKACILTEAARFLNGMLAHVDRLRKENKTLMSESDYVSAEKEELRDDNSMLLSQVEKLRGEIESKNPANVQPCHPVVIFPVSASYPNLDAERPIAGGASSIVRKPCPRYPDQIGSWQSKILEEQLRAGNTN